MPDYEALKVEVRTDPLGLGLAGKTNDQVAAILAATPRPLVVSRTIVPAHEVWEAIVPTERKVLAADDKQAVQSLLSMGTVNIAGANTHKSLSDIFGQGTATRTNLVALRSVSVPRTRGEEIFGVAPTAADIGHARSLT